MEANIPYDAEKVVVRCLQKDLARRFQHLEDLRVELQELAEVPPRKHRLPRPFLARGCRHCAGRGRRVRVQRMHAAPLTDKDMVVLGDFVNATGDSVFDDTLKQGLSVQHHMP